MYDQRVILASQKRLESVGVGSIPYGPSVTLKRVAYADRVAGESVVPGRDATKQEDKPQRVRATVREFMH